MLEQAGRAVQFVERNGRVGEETGITQLLQELFAGEEALRLAGKLCEDERLAGNGCGIRLERVA